MIAVFETHACNCREHDSVIDEYADGVLKHGVVQDVRGRLYATLTWRFNTQKNIWEGTLPLRLLTWGSLGRAFYVAWKSNPTNPNILISLAEGLVNICVLHGNVPLDCCEFVRDYSNLWHSLSLCLDRTVSSGRAVDKFFGRGKVRNISAPLGSSYGTGPNENPTVKANSQGMAAPVIRSSK
jgi:hypothetical protein